MPLNKESKPNYTSLKFYVKSNQTYLVFKLGFIAYANSYHTMSTSIKLFLCLYLDANSKFLL